jgi:hypothetical protein
MLYRTCKHIYDKWIGGATDADNVIFQCGGRNSNDILLAKKRKVNEPKLIDSFRFVTSSYSTNIPSPVTIQVERYNGQDVSASAVVSVSGGTAVAGVDYTNIFPYTVSWADQESGSKNIVITTLSSWGSNKTLSLKLNSLTNLSSGSIMTASVLFVNAGVSTQSNHQFSDANTDFTINKYLNLSNDYTRRTQQVPFTFGNNPLVRLNQAYSSSIQ